MDNKNQKKDFSHIFDELNDAMKAFNNMFGDCEAKKAADMLNNCKCAKNENCECNKNENCECEKNESKESNKCFNNGFDPTFVLKALKDFCENITVEDIAKPIETLANIVESGANTLTGLFEKFSQAIDQVADKFDEFIDDEDVANIDMTNNEQKEEEEGLTIPIGTNEDVSYLCDEDDEDINNKNECHTTPCCCKKEMSESEKKSIRDIIEEEIQRQIPEKQKKCEDASKLNAEKLVTEIENKIKEKKFVFLNKKTKEIQIELEFPLKDIDDITSLFSEASNILSDKHHFSSIQFTAKGINDNINVYAYITL